MAYEQLPLPEQMPKCYHDWLDDLEDLQERPRTTVLAYGQALRRVVHFAAIAAERWQEEFDGVVITPAILESPEELDQVVMTYAVREMRRGERKLSKSTLKLTLAALESYYEWSAIAGKDSEGRPLLKGHPANLKRVRQINKIEQPTYDPEYYRPAEVKLLFETAAAPSESRIRWPERDLAMCGFLAVLGLRASELTDARINWLTQEVLEERDYSATWVLQVLGKGHKFRRLPLSRELDEVVKQWGKARIGRVKELRVLAKELEEADYQNPGAEQRAANAATDYRELADRLEPAPDRPLFVPTTGAREIKDFEGNRIDRGFTYRQLRYWVRRLNREAGIRERSPHALRHTAGVQLAADGVPMNVIQALLGHQSVATTGIYTELVGSALVGVLNRSEANTLLRRELDKDR